MSFFGFGQSAELELVLSDGESRRRVEHKTEEGKKEKYFLFYDGETVAGRVILTLKHPNKRLEHQGIKVEFIGQIGERGLVVLCFFVFFFQVMLVLSYFLAPAQALTCL